MDSMNPAVYHDSCSCFRRRHFSKSNTRVSLHPPHPALHEPRHHISEEEKVIASAKRCQWLGDQPHVAHNAIDKLTKDNR